MTGNEKAYLQALLMNLTSLTKSLNEDIASASASVEAAYRNISSLQKSIVTLQTVTSLYSQGLEKGAFPPPAPKKQALPAE